MNNLKVELNDEQLTTVLHTALLQAVSDKGKEVLLESVVKHLTTVRDGYGNRRTSPLQDALNLAADQFATQHFRALLANDERIVAVVKDLYEQAYQKLLDEKVKEQVSNAMTSTLIKALTGSGY
ncbi:MAG: hypothetical protein WC372_12485 [Candidatus Neomarinimicrobiota bacterium]|jgi:hypothetical protein